MLTSAQIQLIRNADPGVKLPGIDTPTGNPLSASSLVNYTQVSSPAFTYNASNSAYFAVRDLRHIENLALEQLLENKRIGQPPNIIVS